MGAWAGLPPARLILTGMATCRNGSGTLWYQMDRAVEPSQSQGSPRAPFTPAPPPANSPGCGAVGAPGRCPPPQQHPHWQYLLWPRGCDLTGDPGFRTTDRCGLVALGKFFIGGWGAQFCHRYTEIARLLCANCSWTPLGGGGIPQTLWVEIYTWAVCTLSITARLPGLFLFSQLPL